MPKQRGDGLIKSPSGIKGLDEITGGGLPAGRPTLLCGGTGCGKTLLAATFVVNGALFFNEPGVIITFEESSEELTTNVRSLGYDLEGMVAAGHLAIDHIRVDRSEIEETGEYDLEGLFIRLGHAIDTVGARRVMLDTIETLFGGLGDTATLRSEIGRLFRWLKARGVTAVVTAETADRNLTRHGIEEFISDCVIRLDHRVESQVSTRRLRVIKYRGSSHGTNEYPFLIDNHGLTVMPVTSINLAHAASEEQISTGVADLDDMLTGGGVFRGASVLLSGSAGTGKSSLCAHFADASCRRGEPCLYFAFEESPDEMLRNMRRIGLDLRTWQLSDQLRLRAIRPSLYGLEMHLAAMLREIEVFQPRMVVVDSVTSLIAASSARDGHALFLRLLDELKSKGITAILTNLSHNAGEPYRTEMDASSLVDSWILLLNRDYGGEHNRQLYLIKARGISHSNQVREFTLTDSGIRLRPHRPGAAVLTGTAQSAQGPRNDAATLEQSVVAARCRRQKDRRRARLKAQIVALQEALALEEDGLADEQDPHAGDNFRGLP